MTVKLTPARRSALTILNVAPISFGLLCDKLGRNPSSVTSLVGRMKAAGLIQEMGEVFFVTEAGRALLSPEAPGSSKEEGE